MSDIILKEIEKLEEEANKKLQEAERLRNLLELFPDLERRVGRWDWVAYGSPSVNSKVTDYDWRYNCGCCSDSPLEVWPYLETEYGKVHSIPAYFMIGAKGDEWGNYKRMAYSGWQDSLRKYNIPEELIEKISLLFPDDYEIDRDEDDDYL